jgi:hypothetical protein
LAAAAADVPEEWLLDEPGFAGPAALRSAYVARMADRLAGREEWLGEVRTAVAAHGHRPRTARRPQRPAWLEARP